MHTCLELGTIFPCLVVGWQWHCTASETQPQGTLLLLLLVTTSMIESLPRGKLVPLSKLSAKIKTHHSTRAQGQCERDCYSHLSSLGRVQEAPKLFQKWLQKVGKEVNMVWASEGLGEVPCDQSGTDMTWVAASTEEMSSWGCLACPWREWSGNSVAGLECYQ